MGEGLAMGLVYNGKDTERQRGGHVICLNRRVRVWMF